MTLPNKYSSDIDQIPTCVIKMAAKHIQYSLHHEIRPRLSQPVSLSSTVSNKVFEPAYFNRLLKYFLRYNLLHQQQFVFIPKRSTEMAIFNILLLSPLYRKTVDRLSVKITVTTTGVLLETDYISNLRIFSLLARFRTNQRYCHTS